MPTTIAEIMATGARIPRMIATIPHRRPRRVAAATIPTTQPAMPAKEAKPMPFTAPALLRANCRKAGLSWSCWAALGSVGSMPVSYTHLDVYKRQAVARSPLRGDLGGTEP